MEFPLPETGHEKFPAKKKAKLMTKSKPKNSFGRRAHHNALEQQRRGIIRGCFESLRKSVPSLASEDKKLSRSGILRETARYIKMSKERIAQYVDALEELRLQNQLLSREVDCLCLQETPLLCEDFNSFTKALIEGEEITSNPPASNNIPEKFSSYTQSATHVYARDVVSRENDLFGSGEPAAMELFRKKTSSDEEYGIDDGCFVQSPFSIYGPS